jgi:hypothetical protein
MPVILPPATHTTQSVPRFFQAVPRPGKEVDGRPVVAQCGPLNENSAPWMLIEDKPTFAMIPAHSRTYPEPSE